MNFLVYRKLVNLTQKKVANQLGIDRSTVSKWETGKSIPRMEVLLQLIKLYNCTIDELLRGQLVKTG